MRPPRCILCEAEHWTRNPHVTAGVKVRSMVSAVLKPRTNREQPQTANNGVGGKPPTRAAVAVIDPPPYCIVCRTPIPKPKRGPVAQFCSDKCRMRSKRAR